MDPRRAVLDAADIDSRGIEVDLLPADIDQLAHPQRMPEGHEDQQPVPSRVAAVASRRQQLLDLSLGQVLALPVVGVLGATPRTVDFLDFEGLNWMTVFIGEFPP